MPLPALLQPALLWKHFEALSAIPRLSQNERAAGDYVERIALQLGLTSQRDAAGNVLVRKPARPGMEKLPGVVLQAHLDMVGQKNACSSHDFSCAPLRLLVDGDWLHADGTTLGADNGIGAAAALAVLESSELAHGPLSALFTVEEEIGLRGAAKVHNDFLPGEFLINLDADNPAELIVGCAGAADLRCDIPCDRSALPEGWQGVLVTLSGLAGGHSGADIHRGRGNALRLLARLLDDAASSGKVSFRLATLRGGDARNAIPREAQAWLAVPGAESATLSAVLESLARTLKQELAKAEPGLELVLAAAATPLDALTPEAELRLLTFLRACPTGVVRFSDTHPGVVETSNNLAVLSLREEGPARIQCLTRSLVESAKHDVAATVSSLARLAGGSTGIHGDYPGWQPDKASRLLPVFTEACQRILGAPPQVLVVHGGLECGILRAAKPSLDCISCGPLIESMHSPDERVSLRSVDQFFEVLKEALRTLPSA